jgi:hypothetical protein
VPRLTQVLIEDADNRHEAADALALIKGSGIPALHRAYAAGNDEVKWAVVGWAVKTLGDEGVAFLDEILQAISAEDANLSYSGWSFCTRDANALCQARLRDLVPQRLTALRGLGAVHMAGAALQLNAGNLAAWNTLEYYARHGNAKERDDVVREAYFVFPSIPSDADPMGPGPPPERPNVYDYPEALAAARRIGNILLRDPDEQIQVHAVEIFFDLEADADCIPEILRVFSRVAQTEHEDSLQTAYLALAKLGKPALAVKEDILRTLAYPSSAHMAIHVLADLARWSPDLLDHLVPLLLDAGHRETVIERLAQGGRDFKAIAPKIRAIREQTDTETRARIDWLLSRLK